MTLSVHSKRHAFSMHRSGTVQSSLGFFALLLLFLFPMEFAAAKPPMHGGGVCHNTLTPEDTALAVAWAPVIVQALPASLPFRADYITRFDYDGDFDPENNWQNSREYDMPSAAYYWVIRGDRYDYVGYGLYYLQDASGSTNDFRATLLILKKSQSGGHRLLGLLTWNPQTKKFTPGAIDGGSLVSEHKGRGGPVGKGEAIAAIQEIIEPVEEWEYQGITKQKLDLVLDDRGLHPVLYVQEKSHDILLQSPHKKLDFHFTGGIDDWRGRQFLKRDYANGRSGKGGFMSYPQFGVVYHPREKGTTVAKKKLIAKGRLWHHWEMLGYELLPLSSATDKKLPSCVQVSSEDKDSRNTQMPLVEAVVEKMAGEGKKDISNWKRLDRALFRDPKRISYRYFPSLRTIKGLVQLRW